MGVCYVINVSSVINSILLKTPQQTVTEQDKNLVNRNNVTLCMIFVLVIWCDSTE